MKKKTKGVSLYSHESQILSKMKKIATNQSLSREELLKEYLELGSEYDKLLRQTIKITRIGDVNQRKLENQRVLLKEKSDKLKDIAEIKSQFFANISHEFRTPLTLIIGPLEQMLSKSHEIKEKKTLTLMLRNAQRLLGLINQLLELSKFESGKVKLQASRQNIIPFLKGIVSSFELLADQNEVDLTFYAEKDNLTLYFEPGRIEEVICNLLVNALKFTPQGGKIKVSVHQFPPGSGEKVEISVRDTGPGISRDQMASIFDRFYQLDRAFEHHKKGFGIGLALAREHITLHHGEIDVNSSEGEGTEFIIHLPMGKQHLEPGEIVELSVPLADADAHLEGTRDISSYYAYMLEPGRSEPEPETGNVDDIETDDLKQDIVLVVEDSGDMRQYIKEALEPYYSVKEAVNGNEGIAAAKDIIPDIIICDIILPEVDGYEVCRELKNHINTSHIPFILLTAKASEEAVIKGLETGADDYITKPFSTRILSARIKNLIDLRRQLQEKTQRQMAMQPHEISVTSLDQDFFNQLQEAVEKNLSDPDFGLPELANALYLSRATLYRKVYALTGESPKQFIQSYRLKRAGQLLKANFGNVTEVAFEVGFSSSAYFTKCFKEKFNQLPSDFQTPE